MSFLNIYYIGIIGLVLLEYLERVQIGEKYIIPIKPLMMLLKH